MGLRNTNKDLHVRSKGLREHEVTEYNPAGEHSNAQSETESQWSKKSNIILDRSWQKVFLRPMIVLAVAALAVFAAWTFISVKGWLFGTHRVSLSIEGPEMVISGEPVQYTVKYKNNNRVALKDAVLTMNYAEQFRLSAPNEFRSQGRMRSILDLGEIPAKSTKEIVIEGVFAGAQNTATFLEADLGFVPSTTGKLVKLVKRLGVSLKPAELSLVVDAQQAMPSGDVLEYLVTYKNTSEQELSNMRLVAAFPSEFDMISSEPATSDGDHTWLIGAIAPGETGAVRIRGTLTGLNGQTYNTKFTIGTSGAGEDVVKMADVVWLTRLIDPPLRIAQAVNVISGQGSRAVSTGQKLDYEISYRNASDLGLRDVIVVVEFKDDLVDFASLVLPQGGAFDARKKTITWRAADVPELALLAPGASGKIMFSVTVLGRLPIANTNDQNFVVTTRAVIDSPDVPTPVGSNKVVSSNTSVVKIITPVTFVAEGFYNDYVISNSGPLPPEVGKTTTYTLRWSLTNASNDIMDGRVETYLPSWVQWTGNISANDETLQFNPRTQKVTWQIGRVEHGTGYYLPKREVRFQVSVTPTSNQIGSAIMLSKETKFIGRDVFTGVTLPISVRQKDTNLSEDAAVNGRGIVVEAGRSADNSAGIF